MKKIVCLCPLFFALVSFAFELDVLSWDDKVTHKDLSSFAAQNSVLSKTKSDYLRNLGFYKELLEEFIWNNEKKTVEDWLRNGAEREDASTFRSFNHFHNPLKDWQQAGLNDVVTGESSLLWSQDRSNQQNFIERDQTWQMARDHFYFALTSKTNLLRQENFARMFKGLGHQMHFLQDTAVPDHVRNDAHPEDAIFGTNPRFGRYYFETWAKKTIKNLAEMKSFAPIPLFPNVSFDVSYNTLAPATQLFDTNTYDGLNVSAGINQGLSEYTNANFFSNDTIFAAERYTPDHKHYFPYPKKTSTDLQNYVNQTKLSEVVLGEDNIPDTSFWIKKERDGEIIDHFLKPSYYSVAISDTLGDSVLYRRTFYRDEECHKDYAQKLIPRAVGYSAGLLNYFFRGTIEITAPDSFVYSITDGSKTPYVVDSPSGRQHQQFTHIKAKVRNTTPNEAITSGIIQAVARYKIVPNYAPDLSNYPPDGAEMHGIEYSYSVSVPKTLLPEEMASMNVNPTEFIFDFTSNPIPAGITDLHLNVVFKGTLGNEADIAVAVGYKDLMEPTHHVFWNNTDMFSLNGHLYTEQQIMADPNLAAEVVGLNISPETISLQIAYMDQFSPVNPIVPSAAATLTEGRHIRLIVLVDNRVNNFVRILLSRGQLNYTFGGVANQEVGGVWQTPTPATPFRSVKQHFAQGVLRCKPMMVDPVTGNEYCEYPEQEAKPADPSPYDQVIINFP